MLSRATARHWARLADFVGAHLGLDFPPARWCDLQRGFARALPDYGFADAAACIDWLTSGAADQQRLQVLAAQLTIGETYFFREPATLDAVAQTVLPALIRERRGRWQRLRLWSAGCCSGEEAYTLAILLHRLLPDRADWQLTIVATDLNTRFLAKAAAATYGEWSFRNAPPWLKSGYFKPAGPGRYTVIPEIRRMVSFRPLNLVDESFPGDTPGIESVDVIFCRNVLMYFSPVQRQKVAVRLDAALAPGGWLAVSPSEASHAHFPRLCGREFPGAIVFQKPVSEVAPAAAAEPPSLPPVGPRSDSQPAARDTVALALLAHSFADQGRLAEALACCERWLAADKLDAQAHCLRAVVLLERGAEGDADEARRALQRALYLQPDFQMAQVALGGLARALGRNGFADRRMAKASRFDSSAGSRQPTADRRDPLRTAKAEPLPGGARA